MPEFQLNTGALRIDRTNLYREETFTDLKAGAIQRLTPVRADGGPDDSRPALFIGEASLLTPGGALPIRSEIAAANLEQAIERYPEAMRQGLEQLMDDAREMQRQQASRIVVPSSLPPEEQLRSRLITK